MPYMIYWTPVLQYKALYPEINKAPIIHRNDYSAYDWTFLDTGYL